MSLDCVLACVEAALSCPAVAELNATTQITVRKTVWSGGAIGKGVEEHADLVLPMIFPVRQVSAREVGSSGGLFSAEDVLVSDLVPAYSAGGYSALQLDPARGLEPGQRDTEVLYLLSGAIEGVYSLVRLDTSDPVAWTMLLRRTRRSP